MKPLLLLLLLAIPARAAVLTGTNGADTLKGADEDDTILGREGNDFLYGEGGDDTIQGEQDNDRLFGGAGNDALSGGPGNDVLDGGEGNDSLDGDAGDDEMLGGEGDDVMSGGAGNDQLGGGAGDDQLDGGAGNDFLRGGDGRDTLKGGEGNDAIVPGKGDDTVLAGAGDDLVTISAGNVEREETIDCGPGEDRVRLPTIGYGNRTGNVIKDPETGGTYTLKDCEHLTFGGDYGQYNKARFWVSTSYGPAGLKLTVTGFDLAPFMDIDVTLGGKKVGTARADREGRMRLDFKVPKLPPSTYPLLFGDFPQALYFTVSKK